MSTLAIFIKDAYFPNLDIGKVLTLCLIHEFGEIIAGDITPEDGISAEEQSKREEEGVRKLLTGIPNTEHYVNLRAEFERGISLEAKLVRQLDKLDMAFQSKIYELQHDVDLDRFVESARKRIESPELMALIDEIKAIKK